MKEYNKYVRDKVPEIMISKGVTPEYYTIEDDKSFINGMAAKLLEESMEFNESGFKAEELVDVFTVLVSLLKAMNISYSDFLTMYCKKLEEKGGFDKRIFLVKEE